MCGITGAYVLKQSAASRLQAAGSSLEQLRRRGPDAEGHFADDTVALGHRRLSVIDTSEGAGQPMTDHTGRYYIVFNGEIFNYRWLSDRYLGDAWKKHGQPRTHSDTEVLLYLLIEYGTQCLSWLHGFFAFAFYDRETGTLLLARDRYGKKPLLYYTAEDYVAFASEMKALLAWGIPRKLDYTVLHQYLQLNYIPQPQSMLQGVARLKQGHYMKITPDGITENQPYYQLEIHAGRYGDYSYEEAQAQLVTLMDAAVQDRMISDVPLGAFLSGGIDSSVVVALASRYAGELNTFSIGYKDNAFFDETKYAQLVAEKYKTRHTVFSLTNNDFLEHVHGVLDYLDEPFADSSAIPVYILSQYTRQHVTVALSGDGGDEVFAGYNKHMGEWQIRRQSVINRLVAAGLPLWSLLPKSRNNPVTNTFRKIHRFAAASRLPEKDRYWQLATYLNSDGVFRLLSAESAGRVVAPRLEQEQQALLAGFRTGDFNEVLLTDMMSMANSLEVRSPFLDHRVVDFAFGLPASYKIDGAMKKKVLQDAFRHMLPADIYNRPKHGFEIPLLGWFRKELWGMIDDDLLSYRFVAEQGIFNPEATELLKKQLRSRNPGDSHATVWALIVFQYWWKKYFS